MKRRVVPPIINTQSVAKETGPSELPKVATTQVGGAGDVIMKDGAVVMSQPRVSKPGKKATTRKVLKREDSKRSVKTPSDVIDDFVCSGDVVFKQRPTPKLLEHNFAASISSVKPSRRVVNISNPRVKQKG